MAIFVLSRFGSTRRRSNFCKGGGKKCYPVNFLHPFLFCSFYLIPGFEDFWSPGGSGYFSFSGKAWSPKEIFWDTLLTRQWQSFISMQWMLPCRVCQQKDDSATDDTKEEKQYKRLLNLVTLLWSFTWIPKKFPNTHESWDKLKIHISKNHHWLIFSLGTF